MLIIALVLALIGLAALVFAVVTSSQLVAWVCIVASVIGVVLLIIDAVRERRVRAEGDDEEDQEDLGAVDEEAYDYPEELPDEDQDQTAAAELPEETGSEATEESAVPDDDRAN